MLKDKSKILSGSLFVISAPSGGGKTSLVNELLAQLTPFYRLERVVTYTSRLPRAGEIPGKDYHFVSKEDFETKIEENFFLEWSTIYGAYYGSPRHELKKLWQKISLLMIVDQEGACRLIRDYGAIAIWITPATIGTLEKRLIQRGSESEPQRNFRLELAQKELSHWKNLSFFKYKIVNTDHHQDHVIEALKQVIKTELAVHLSAP